jgi:hypothetical protein
MKTFKNIMLALMAVFIIFLLYQWKCTGQKSVDPPIVETVKKQDEKKVAIVKEDTRITDSVIKENKKLKDAVAFWKESHRELQNDYDALGNVIDHQLNDPANKSDYTNNLAEDFNKLKVINAKKDSACNNTIGSLQLQVDLSEYLVKQKENTNKKLLAAIDTCLGNQKKLQAYLQNVKPRNQLYAGISFTVYPALGYGVDVGLKLKSGWMLEARAMSLNGTSYGQLAFKHTISLRK